MERLRAAVEDCGRKEVEVKRGLIEFFNLSDVFHLVFSNRMQMTFSEIDLSRELVSFNVSRVDALCRV